MRKQELPPEPESSVATLPVSDQEQVEPRAPWEEKTPQEFYDEITQRKDVRTILEELADS